MPEINSENTGDLDDEIYDNQDWVDELEEEEANRCQCPYCYCLNDTQYGGICSECLAGAHQG